MEDVRVFTAQEVATILKVSSKTLYKLIQFGELPVIRVRGQIRITSQALDRFLEGGQNG